MSGHGWRRTLALLAVLIGVVPVSVVTAQARAAAPLALTLPPALAQEAGVPAQLLVSTLTRFLAQFTREPRPRGKYETTAAYDARVAATDRAAAERPVLLIELPLDRRITRDSRPVWEYRSLFLLYDLEARVFRTSMPDWIVSSDGKDTEPPAVRRGSTQAVTIPMPRERVRPFLDSTRAFLLLRAADSRHRTVDESVTSSNGRFVWTARMPEVRVQEDWLIFTDRTARRVVSWHRLTGRAAEPSANSPSASSPSATSQSADAPTATSSAAASSAAVSSAAASSAAASSAADPEPARTYDIPDSLGRELREAESDTLPVDAAGAFQAPDSSGWRRTLQFEQRRLPYGVVRSITLASTPIDTTALSGPARRVQRCTARLEQRRPRRVTQQLLLCDDNNVPVTLYYRRSSWVVFRPGAPPVEYRRAP